MRKFLALVLICVLVLSGCNNVTEKNNDNINENNNESIIVSQKEEISFDNMSDPKLLTYMEDTIYSELVTLLDSEEYFVENIDAVYYSKEYMEEVAYNSQSNIYFGYTLAELDSYFEGERYVFTLGNDGKTTVEVFEKYDDTYDRALKNVAVGTGVIFVCVTVSVLSAGAVPAVSMIFAASAKTGTVMALSSGFIGGVASGVVTGIETGDFDEAMKAAALSSSDGFKWGAFTGVLTGGIAETAKYQQAMKALKGVELNGLTVQQAAEIQMESRYPVDVIKQFTSMKQYEICKSAGLSSKMVNGKTALIRNIDLNYVDDATGLTNLELMQKGYAPIEPMSGTKYQLHHIGQKKDSTLAILTEAEHMKGGNDTIWHKLDVVSEVHDGVNNWDTQRKQFWKAMAKLVEGGT